MPTLIRFTEPTKRQTAKAIHMALVPLYRDKNDCVESIGIFRFWIPKSVFIKNDGGGIYIKDWFYKDCCETLKSKIKEYENILKSKGRRSYKLTQKIKL